MPSYHSKWRGLVAPLLFLQSCYALSILEPETKTLRRVDDSQEKSTEQEEMGMHHAIVNIIRHGEDCSREGADGLVGIGIHRANYLKQCMGNRAKTEALPFGAPTVLAAAWTEHHRPRDTLAPLAEALNLTINEVKGSHPNDADFYAKSVLSSLSDSGTAILAVTIESFIRVLRQFRVPDFEEFLEKKRTFARTVRSDKGDHLQWPHYQCHAPELSGVMPNCHGEDLHRKKLAGLEVQGSQQGLTASEASVLKATCSDEIWQVKLSRPIGKKDKYHFYHWKAESVTELFEGFQGHADEPCKASLGRAAGPLVWKKYMKIVTNDASAVAKDREAQASSFAPEASTPKAFAPKAAAAAKTTRGDAVAAPKVLTREIVSAAAAAAAAISAQKQAEKPPPCPAVHDPKDTRPCVPLHGMPVPEKRSLPTPAKTLERLASKVNCVGSWSGFSECSASCGGGQQMRTFQITIPAANGGSNCPKTHGYLSYGSCNTASCPNPLDRFRISVDALKKRSN